MGNTKEKSMSETAIARPYLAKFCQEPLGIDIGFGGDAIVPHALTLDQYTPYTNVGGDKQILRGDCRDLSGFCDDSLSWVYQSHVLEDWTWDEIPAIVREWRRVIKPGGLWVNCCPDEPIYSKHCRETSQPYNLAHKNNDFTLATFKERILSQTGPWEIVYENPLVNTYSWMLVCRKV